MVRDGFHVIGEGTLEISQGFAAHWINAHRSHGPTPGRFRVKPIPHRHHAAGKRKIRQRLDRPVTAPSPQPVFTASNLHDDAADKTQAIPCGGISAIHLLSSWVFFGGTRPSR